MKSFLAFILFLFTVTGLSAQIQRGTVLVGGTVGFNNVSEDGNGYTTVNIAPSAGFFLTDRFALGSSLAFNLIAADGESNSSFGLTPFARYYFNGSGPARFFGQAQIGFLTGSDSFFEDNSTAWLFGLGLGADFFLNNNVAIEGLLGYQRINYPDGDFGLNNIGLNFGIAAFIGNGE